MAIKSQPKGKADSYKTDVCASYHGSAAAKQDQCERADKFGLCDFHGGCP